MNTTKLTHLLLFILILVISIPIFRHGLWDAHDALAHFQRAVSVFEEVKNQQFPPLFNYWTPGQLGYSWQIFYPPLSSILILIFGALTGFSDAFITIKITYIFIFSLTACSSYISCYLFTKDKVSAAICSALYISSAYFINNAYTRAALGELLAMSFMPLLIAGLVFFVNNNSKRWILPFSAGMIFLSNIPSFVICLIFSLIYLAINFKKILNLNNFKIAIIWFSLLLLVTLFYWAPLIYQYRNSDIYAFSGLKRTYETMYNYSYNVKDVISLRSANTGLTAKGMYVTPGLIVILTSTILIITASTKLPKIGICAIIFLTMSTNLFPWYLISNKVPLLSLAQFPWRAISIATAGLCIISSLYIGNISKKLPNLAPAIVLLCIFSAFPVMKKAYETRLSSFNMQFIFNDYLTMNSLNNKKAIMKAFADGHYNYAKISSFRKGYPIFEVCSSKTTEIETPVIWYSGYKIRTSGNEISSYKSKNGLLSLTPLKGCHEYLLNFDNRINLYSLIISFITCTLILGVSIVRVRKRAQ